MSLTVLAPLRLEALALRRGLRDHESSVVRAGMGPARARGAAERLVTDCSKGPLAVAGVCGGVDPALRSGDVVVATALRTEDGGARDLPGAEVLANAVRKLGLICVSGTILCVEQLGRSARHAAAGHEAILAVDMESAWLAPAAGEGPFAVLRVVADAGGQSVYHPRILVDGARALAVLRRAAPALEDWARASGPRLIDDHRGLDPAWLSGTRTIGLTAGASARERLVEHVVGEFAGLGPVEVEDRTVAEESIEFNLSKEVS